MRESKIIHFSIDSAACYRPGGKHAETRILSGAASLVSNVSQEKTTDLKQKSDKNVHFVYILNIMMW
jgi:hypothetical protein